MRTILFNPVAKLTSSTVLGTGLTFVLLPIITRLYSTNDFGELSLWSTSLGFSLSLVFFHSDRLILTEKSDDSGAVAALNFYALVLGSIFFPLLLWVLSYLKVFSFGKIPNLLLLVFPFALFVQGSSRYFKSVLIRFKKFGTVSFSAIGNSIATSIAKIGLGFINAGSFSLAIADIVGDVISALILFRRSKHRFSDLSMFKEAFSLFRRNVLVLGFGQSSTFLNSLAQLMPVHIVTSFYGIQSAGIFALALRVASLPQVHLGRARADVYQADFSQLIRAENGPGLKRLFFKYLFRDFFMGLGIFIVMAIISPYLFVPIFGEGWEGGGMLVSILALWQFGAFLVSPFGMILVLLKKQSKKLIYDTFAVLASVSLIVLVQFYSFSFQELALSMAGLYLMSYVIYLAIVYMEVYNFCESHMVVAGI